MQGAGWTERSEVKLDFSKFFGGRKNQREMFLSFEKLPGGNYKLVPPRYVSRCQNSNFDFNTKEGNEIRMRSTLNSSVLFKTIKDLKKEQVWECVENKDFLVPNMLNKKSKKEKIRADLKELLL
jgi:hypothetical protein